MDPTSSLSEGFAHLSVGDLNQLHEDISQDSTPTLTRVSRDRDLFIDDDHKPLDEKIMRHFSAFCELNREPDLAALLSTITVGDDRLVTFSEEKA